MKSYAYAPYSTEQLEKLFDVSSSLGLTAAQVKKRQQKYGLNQITKQNKLWLTILARQFESPFLYLLIIAGIISFALHNTIDSVVIFAIISLNLLIGFIQEYRAERAIALLRQQFTTTIIVTRNGTDALINSIELVPGDSITLKPGDYVPADVRIIETNAIQIDESALTGESKPVYKKSEPIAPTDSIYQAENSAFWGTHVISGKARAIVINTGIHTVFGDINTLALNTVRLSSFQLRIAQLSKFLLYLVLVTLIGLYVLHFIIKPESLLSTQLLLFAIAIAVGIIPEALPLVTTYAMSTGALLLAQKNVLVKRLSAIEDLGSITLLCTDKTGTLTQNKLEVQDIYAYNQADPLYYAYLACPHTNQDPLDIAIRAQFNKTKQAPKYKNIDEIPFDPSSKKNIMLVTIKSETIVIMRGAYEEIIKQCIPIENKEKITAWISENGLAGRRTFAVAHKKLSDSIKKIDTNEKELIFDGLIALADPIKPHTEEAVRKAHELGISLIMLTGDSAEVGFSVATQLGMVHDQKQVITGAEFIALDPATQLARISHYKVFARVTPELKYHIVNLLSREQLVGFLGEGINDAPALEAAHVGIVVKEASALAKDAADIIILKKNLGVIIDGIIQGRKTFANILKYIRITLSSSMGNLYSIAIASLLIDFLPLLPLQILLVNLLSDFPLITLATDTVSIQDLRRPSKYDTKYIAFTIILFGMISSFFDFITFGFFFRRSPHVLQTNWFIESLLTELVIIFSLRTRLPFYNAQRPSNKLLVFSLISGAITLCLPFTRIGTELFKFTTPTTHDLLIILAIVTGYFVVSEVVKQFYFKLFYPDKQAN